MSTLNTCTSSTRPASPSDGDMLYETDSYKTIIWDDTASAWQEYMSSSSPYDLDGTNSVSKRPLFHFDAAKINGVDASGNPSDGGSLTTQWKSSTGEGIYDYRAQATTSLQPTWYSSGENSLPYVDFDGGDSLFSESQHPVIYGPFVWFQVMKSDNGWWVGAPQGGSAALFTHRSTNILYYYNSGGNGYVSGENSQNSTVTSVTSTRMLLFEKPSTTDRSHLYVDGDNAQGPLGSGASSNAISFYGYGEGVWLPDGRVYEMALWAGDGINATSGPLSTTDKNALIDYVENKYSLSGFTDF